MFKQDTASKTALNKL